MRSNSFLASDKCETWFSTYVCWERDFEGRANCKVKVSGEGAWRPKTRKKGLSLPIPGIGETLCVNCWLKEILPVGLKFVIVNGYCAV